MKKKIKLLTSLSTFCLAIAVLCFGVFAAIKVTYTVSGSISYEVTDAHVDISTTVYYSASQMTEGELYQNIEEIEDGTTDLSTLKTVHEVSTTGQEVDDYVFADTTALADLKFDSEHKTYFFAMNVTNRGANNVWAIVEDDINDPTNTLQVNNFIQTSINTNETKAIIFAVTLEDATVSITSAEDTAFNYSIKVGVGDVAQENSNLEKLGFTLNGDTYTVTAPTDLTKAVGTVIIPKTYNGKPVTAIADCTTQGGGPTSYYSVFKDCNYETIVIQNNITSLQNGVLSHINAKQLFCESQTLGFASCAYNSNLVTLKLPNIQTLGDYGFYYCDNLKNVLLSDSMDSIGQESFAYCKSLTNITLSAKTLKSSSFAECSNLTNLKFTKNLESFNGSSFRSCSIENIIVEDGGVYTSKDSNGREVNCVIEKETKSIILGASNTIIPADGSVIKISGYSFYGRANLTKIDIPSNIVNIESHAFSSINLSEVVMMHTSGTVEINSYAFSASANATVKFADGASWSDGTNTYDTSTALTNLYSTTYGQTKTWTITTTA